MAARMSASSFSLSHGFCTKFSAPARIASTTFDDRAVRRNHDHRQIRLHLQNARQQFDAALARKRQVQQQQVELAVPPVAPGPPAPSAASVT